MELDIPNELLKPGTIYYPPEDGRAIGAYKFTTDKLHTYATQLFFVTTPLTINDGPYQKASVVQGSDFQENFIPVNINGKDVFVIESSLLATFHTK